VHRVPAGDNADLIELGDVTAAELHAAAARVRAEEGVLACIVGHSSLYVIRGEGGARATVTSREPRELRVRVAFDGVDLPALLERVSREEFLARVATLRLTARYLGFRGGFAYLEGWPEEWAMPRRPTSRPVPRGTFAVAGNVAGFYPIDSPGGWNLLGRTDVDLEHALMPGDVIVIDVVSDVPAPAVSTPRVVSPFMTRVAPPDWSRIERGVSPGGPFDDIAAAVAMSAVSGDVELYECAMIAPQMHFERDGVVAWCTPDLTLLFGTPASGRLMPVAFRAPAHVPTTRGGSETLPASAGVDAGAPLRGGFRAYLAMGATAQTPITARRTSDRHVIRMLPGPHDVGVREIECEVTPQLNRVGIRLRPLRALHVRIPADLRSIGMQCGTVQLHPDGSLVAMGPDHPVTGGYLQPMTILTTERWKLAQLMPGERVTLRYEPNE
jgi:allophanate hydrolase subunit 1